MRNWFKLLTTKEIFQLLVYRFGLKVSQLSRYSKNCGPIMEEIQDLLNRGFYVERESNFICVKGISTTDSFSYLIRPLSTDKSVFQQVIVDKEYMPMVDIINRMYAKQSIHKIVDAGSNIGMTTLFFHHFFSNAVFISIEPEQDNYELQKRNLQINGLSDSVTILKSALWKNNTDVLSISNNFRDGKAWSKSVILKGNDNESTIKPVTIKDIKNLFGVNSIIDILKIDIEGSETELFRDQEFIDILKNSVRFLCLEIHDELGIRQDIYKIFSEINVSYQENGETCFCINNNLN